MRGSGRAGLRRAAWSDVLRSRGVRALSIVALATTVTVAASGAVPSPAEARAVRVAAPEPAALREALVRACGLRGRVQKRRWLLLAQNGAFQTRIHPDQVQRLGDFMELEVVLQDGQTDAQGAAVAEALMDALGLAEVPRLAGSYLDLLAAA